MDKLIPADIIPPGAAWTDRQGSLLQSIAGPDFGSDGKLLIRRAMQAVDPEGNCIGLAYAGAGGRTVLAMFLHSAITLAIAEKPSLEPLRSPALAVVDKTDEVLLSLARQANWKSLGVPPRTAENRVLHFHCSIANSPAYPFVAGRLQRGIAAKIDQLAGQPAERADRRLGGLLLAVIPIVKKIPAANLGSGVSGIPADIDAVVHTAILHMRRRRAGRLGHSRYAPASYKVFWNNWRELFFARPREKEFHRRNAPSRRISSIAVFRGNGSGNFVDDPDYEAFIAEWNRIEGLEGQETNGRRARQGSGKDVSRHGKLDPGKAAILLKPSSTMPGSLPKVILALLDSALDELAVEWPKFNAGTARGLVDCMLYLGRPADWLLRMRLGRRPSSIQDCREPIFDPLRWAIHHRPDLYLGMPEYLLPPSRKSKSAWKEFERAWRDHDAVFEPVQLVHQIRLPVPLCRSMRSLWMERRKALRNHPDSALSDDGCPFWLWQDAASIIPLTLDHVDLVLDRVTELIRMHIPGYPRLRQVNLCRTFEGHFSDHGLRPELGFYVSGRLKSNIQMPLRYSRVSQVEVAWAHAAAADAFRKKIHDERMKLGLPSRKNSRSWKPPRIPDAGEKDFVGSWHCARSDLIRPILAELQDAIKSPSTWDPGLPRRKARHNAHVRMAAFGLALLNGIRPNELVRLRNQAVDIQRLWIAIRGKPRPHQAAYRRIPIFSGMGSLLDAIRRETKGSEHPRRKLLGFYNARSKWRPATVMDLEKVLVDAGERQGLHAVFDLYSLRHRFRTDCMEAGVPSDMVNFLMGHESTGLEPFSIYRDARPGTIQEIYQEAAHRAAEKYGWDG